MVGDIVRLGKYYFFYWQGVKSNWIGSNQTILDYVGGNFGQSDIVSLVVGKLPVTEVDKSLLPNFKTKEAMKEHAD